MTDVNEQVKTAAMQAFEAFKTELAPKLGKLDAFDQEKFAKVEKAMNDGIEESQKANARLKAVEDAKAALETEVKNLTTAFNRPGAVTDTDKAKEIATKRNKLFNEFARCEARELHFEEFMRTNVKDEAERKALSVGSDPAGGYLVMPEFGGIITTKVYETSPMRQLATVTTIGTDTYEVVLDNGEAAAGWVGETATRSETDTPTLGKLSIPVHEMYAEPRATQKVIDDSIIDMEAWLGGKVGDIFGRTEATTFVAGDGVNKPKGLLSYTAGTDISLGQVQQVVSGSASTYTYDGLIDLQNALKEPYQRNAAFLIRRASNTHLLKIKDGEGRPIFNLSFDKNAGSPATLMGQPLYFAADVPAVASNALAMIYGDIREAYQIVDRMGIRVLRDAYTAKPYIKFYTTKRTGGAVKNFEAFKIHKIAAA